MSAVLEARGAEYGFGSLSYGADIIWAELLLERGAHIHIVLHVPPDAFIDQSVRAGGDRWVDRFDAVLTQATQLTTLSSGPTTCAGGYRAAADAADAADAAFAQARAMAAIIVCDAVLAAVWDGELAEGVAGTAADVAAWRSTGSPVDIVPMAGRRVR